MKKRVFFFILLWIVFLAAIVFVTVDFTNDKSRLCLNGENLVALNHQAVKAKVVNPKKTPYLYFKFTDNQKARLLNMSKKQNGASIQIDISILKKNNASIGNSIAYGLLYEDDFEKPNKLKSEISKRPLATGDCTNLTKDIFSLSLCTGASTDDKSVEGFFVYGNFKYEVKGVSFEEVKIGWNKESNLFAFSSSGGKLDSSFTKADFSSAIKTFPNAMTNVTVTPKIEVTLYDCADIGTYDNQTKVYFSIGGENISVRRSPNQNKVVLQSSAFSNAFKELDFSKSKDAISSVMLMSNDTSLLPTENGEVLTPIPTDLGLILDWPQKNWRCTSYELYSWNMFPSVLFFDIASYDIQNKFFTRLAYFVEKAGYKGTLVDDEFVATKHGYNAHDYRDKDLADFFTEAYKQRFSLNEYEILLRKILVQNKIIVENSDGTFSQGSGAIVSISRESPDYLRNTFIAHESWHGIYFTDEDFRNTVSVSYLMFDEPSLVFLKTFWATQNGLGYDLTDDYLMENEFMAYLMQQPVSRTEQYFLQVAGRGSVNKNEPELAKYVRKTNAEAFTDAAALLNDYAFTKWGLAAGRVSLVSR